MSFETINNYFQQKNSLLTNLDRNGYDQYVQPYHPQQMSSNNTGFYFRPATGAPATRSGFWSALTSFGRTVSDSALGFGSAATTATRMYLFQKIEPPINLVRSGVFRAAGGALSALMAGYRTYQAAKEDLSQNDLSFPRARRESVLCVSSITAGGAVGAAAGLATAAVGAKGYALLAAGLLGIGAVGYTVSATRNVVENLYDRFVGKPDSELT